MRHVYAAILAQACNFGLTTMADIADLTYRQLAWTTDWYLREETLKAAFSAPPLDARCQLSRGRPTRYRPAADFPFDPDLRRHVSPIEWKNVILYGEIKIDPAKLKMRDP